MTNNQHLLIRASAGTGKTYRLSGRFLALLFQGVAPERILATTFTRKAAGEILDRVLERLVDALDDPQELADLAKATEMPGIDRDACEALLASLTKNLHTFQVRTIDSFFVHLVRLFALDLELPSDWNICDERVDERLRSEAMQSVLAVESKEELLLLLRELSKGGAGRSVQTMMMDRTRDLRPAHLESRPEAWDSFGTGNGLSDDELRAALGAVEAAELPTTAKGEPNKNWLKARDTLLRRAQAGLWEELFTEGGLGVAYLSEEQVYSRKPFPDAFLEALAPLMAHASHCVLKELRHRNLAAQSLTETFESTYQEQKRQEGSYSFSDLPHALAPRTASKLPIDERELDLWFRLDGRIDHLLLDEFQDTSPVQWRILEPIASEIASDHSGERSFFCVGDVKQSIYSFRHAEPRLLADLPRMLPGIEDEEMDLSFRSSQCVLDAVNLVFSETANNSALAADELASYRSACAQWSHGYREHKAAKDIPGAVSMFEAPESENVEASLIEAAVKRVLTLRQEAPAATIGILLRKRKWIPRLIRELREHDVDASGEGGTPLTDARSVLAYLSLLHLADHPEDKAAAFHLASSPFGKDFDLEDPVDDQRRRELSRQWRRQLSDEGLGEFTRALAQRVAANVDWSAWDRARFSQLMDQAFAFEAQGERRSSAFVDHVRSKNVEAPGGSSVRVMTIHASKGLEFDAVLLPELTGSFVNLRSTLHSHRQEPEAPFDAVSLAISKKLKPLSQELSALYDHNTTRAVEDSLCVLYVAMTRAARRLEMIVPWVDPDKNVNVPETHHVLRAAFAPHGLHEADEEGLIWSHVSSATGNEWAEGLKSAQQETAQEPQTTFALAKSDNQRHATRRSPSAQEGGDAISIKELLNPKGGAALGTWVHRCLEDLDWAESFATDPATLAASPGLRNASEPDQRAAAEVVAQALQHDEIRNALSKANYDSESYDCIEVFTEDRFIRSEPNAHGESELWSGSIDRLVVGFNGETASFAEVIDYKSDAIERDELENRAAHYATQLEAYRAAIAERYQLAREDVRARLIFLRLGVVHDLG